MFKPKRIEFHSFSMLLNKGQISGANGITGFSSLLWASSVHQLLLEIATPSLFSSYLIILFVFYQFSLSQPV